MLLRTTAVLVLCTVGYLALPTWTSPSGNFWVVRLLGSLVVFAVLVALVVALARRARRASADELRWQLLLIALYLVILLFALVYLGVVRVDPGAFPGIRGKVDALYFSVMLVSTVGLGDVHPVGTLGKLVVTINILVNTVYIGTVLRVVAAPRQPPSGARSP